MEEWVASLNIEPWVSTVLVYLLGIATGFLLFGGGSAASVQDDEVEHTEPGEDNPETVAAYTDTGTGAGTGADALAEADDAPIDERETAKALFSSRKADARKANGKSVNGDPAPNSMKLGALESELRKAHQMLADADEDQAVYQSQLDNLEQALKRANGRLKLVMKAVKKAKPEEG